MPLALSLATLEDLYTLLEATEKILPKEVKEAVDKVQLQVPAGIEAPELPVEVKFARSGAIVWPALFPKKKPATDG